MWIVKARTQPCSVSKSVLQKRNLSSILVTHIITRKVNDSVLRTYLYRAATPRSVLGVAIELVPFKQVHSYSILLLLLIIISVLTSTIHFPFN